MPDIKVKNYTEQLRVYLRKEEYDCILRMMHEGSVVVLMLEEYIDPLKPNYAGRMLLGVPPGLKKESRQ